MIKTTLLFFATALCEIIGCFLPWLWLKRNASIWLLLPAGISLALFVWLLTLHPAASGRVYAAYGGVYVCTAGNDSNLLIVFYVQIMPDDFVMQLHRF
ncbi:hypothetical protein AW061_19520 [Escherichia coli]|nr:hypothetical protein AW061_19520 [Escherichia coli]